MLQLNYISAFGYVLQVILCCGFIISKFILLHVTLFRAFYRHFTCLKKQKPGPRSAVSNVSGNRCESGCRSRGREFDPGPVPYFRGD